MFEKIKNNLLWILGGLTALLGLLLFWQRSKTQSAEAIADNFDTLNEVNKIDGKIEANNGKLESEGAKREDIKKEIEDAKANTDGNADFFNRRN